MSTLEEIQVASAPESRERLPKVRIVTALGDLVVELAADRAPKSTAAFLRAVDSGAYDGGAFSRIVRADNDQGSPPIEVVQASCHPATVTTADVPVETTSVSGLRHEDGAISLARRDGGDATAHSFFISVGSQPGLDQGGGRTDDGLGFPAFGRMVEGLDVLQAIHGIQTGQEAPVAYLRGQLALEPAPIYRIGREGEGAAAQLAQLAEDYWRFRVWEFPSEATAAGVKSENHRLDGAAEGDWARRARVAGLMAARARLIESGGLDEAQATTLSLLIGQLTSIVEGYALGAHRRPMLFPFGFADVADQLAQSTPLDGLQDREGFAARLQRVPGFIAENLALLRAGLDEGVKIPRVLVPRIKTLLDSQLAEQGGLVARIAQRLIHDAEGGAADENAALRARIATILTEEVLPAIRAFKAFIEALEDEALTDEVGLSSQPGGRHYYRYKVRQQTSINLEPETIHARGLEEIDRISAELDGVLSEMGRPGERTLVAAELEALISQNAELLLAKVRAFSKKVDGLLPRLFGRMPRITYAVEPLPVASSQALPPALAQPSPADRSMPGVFWLTSAPERCPHHLIVPLTLHEAWPGHLMQLALAHELDDLPAFRRYGWADYNGYVEGWALYCERLGYELGLYDDPTDRFGLLSLELWRAARLVVDTGLHWKGWSRQQAITFMLANTFLPQANIEAEVDRYIGMPAQALSYKIGERAISGLRGEAQATLGDSFSLRDFHDELLGLGPVSLEALGAHMQRWINRKQNS
ncbi:DUF885 family protein [uncultured Caulobacter sp.]|uniref:DUF885 family protein n=1 Tax=uncultured Caulobacter sp. TaxID=158749 RepID=UPI00262E2176|nr:DUF885 family protein [uncultured Caulobacter sp.]